MMKVLEVPNLRFTAIVILHNICDSMFPTNLQVKLTYVILYGSLLEVMYTGMETNGDGYDGRMGSVTGVAEVFQRSGRG